MTSDHKDQDMRPAKEFFGRWKYSKRLGCWVWRWKYRRPRTVGGPATKEKS